MATANTNPESAQGLFKKAAKTALVAHEMSVTELARSLGLARNTVSIAINHPTMFPGVKRRISTLLKLP